MEENKISCIYYPTTIVLLDDDPSLLQQTQYQLGSTALCKTFTDPEQALQYIADHTKKRSVLGSIVGLDTTSLHYTHTSRQLPLNYDVSRIYEHAYDSEQYDELSVVVVDYAMPKMNGEEFCEQLRKLKGNNLKIILLTGEADEKTAVKMFNLGVIDRFLRKGNIGLNEELPNCILNMQRHFFHAMSSPLLQGLSTEKDSCLSDPGFPQFFAKICHELKPTSYYLIEISGSFLFIDHAGVPTWLLIKTLSELQEIVEQMRDAELPEEWCDAVEQGELIPYIGDHELDFYSESCDPKKYLFPAQSWKGSQEYRYSLVKNLPAFHFEAHKILSLDDYIRSL